MKTKYIISCLLLTYVSQLSAQDNTSNATMGKPSIGIYGGINFQNINGKDDAGDKLTNSLVTRYHFGVNGEIPIAPEFFFQIGLQYIGKGTKGSVVYNDNNGAHTITREIAMSYIEMPLHLAYKPLVGRGHLILGFGPYLGYSISGKAKFSGNSAPSDADIDYQKTVPAGATNNLVYFKKPDVGADFFVGYEFFNGLNLVLNSQLGLININAETSTKLTNKNTGFGLSVGYRIKRR